VTQGESYLAVSDSQHRVRIDFDGSFENRAQSLLLGFLAVAALSLAVRSPRRRSAGRVVFGLIAVLAWSLSRTSAMAWLRRRRAPADHIGLFKFAPGSPSDSAALAEARGQHGNPR
jgi:hypothetical protein